MGILKKYVPQIEVFNSNRLTKEQPKQIMLVEDAEDVDTFLKLVDGKYQLSNELEGGELKKQTRVKGFLVDFEAKTLKGHYLDLPRASFAKNILPVLNSEYATELIEFSVVNAGTMQATYSAICLPNSKLEEVKKFAKVKTEQKDKPNTDF